MSMEELDVSLVRRQLVPFVWPKVRGFLEKATEISEGRYDIQDLYERLTKDPDWVLWVVFSIHPETKEMNIVAAITSTWTLYPQMKALHGQFLGGARIEEWQDKFCSIFDEWGRDNECDAVEFTGRKGWTKLLDRNGYRPVFVTYQKDLH